MYESMFNKELVNLSINASSSDELFDFVGKDAQSKGFANSGYIEGLKKREAAYPTGLIFPNLQLALPHVGPEFVAKPFIYTARTTNSLEWLQMGDEKPMRTSNFLFLGIKEPSKQVGLLAAIIAAFKDEDFIKAFLAADTNEAMEKLLVNKFTQVAA